jgi:hypothetical protein
VAKEREGFAIQATPAAAAAIGALRGKLATTLSIGAISQGRKHKPACCGKAGWPTIGEVRGKEA